MTVDRVVLAWIMLAPDPQALLEHIEQAFLDDAGRLGYMRTGRWMEALSGGREDLEHVAVTDDGMLTGIIQVREDAPALNWERGTVSIWRGGEMLPATVVATLEGRRIEDVVEHPLLPRDAVVAHVSNGDVWLRLACTGISVDIESARGTVMDATSGKGSMV